MYGVNAFISVKMLTSILSFLCNGEIILCGSKTESYIFRVCFLRFAHTFLFSGGAVMSNFIEELYYGNIDMQEMPNSFTVKARNKLKELIAKEENIKSFMSDDVKKLFDEYADIYSDYLHLSNIEKFISGFRVGAKFTFDTFKNAE